MNFYLRIAFLTCVFGCVISHAAEPEVVAAAQKFYPGYEWKHESVLAADFNCDGRRDLAILGTSSGQATVAIFLHGLGEKPDSMSFSRFRNSLVKLKIESLDVSKQEFEKMIGGYTEGYQPSRRCKGLNLGDEETDSAHIFWSHTRKEFEAWSL